MSIRNAVPFLMILALGVSMASAEVVPTADRMDAVPLTTVERLELAPVDLAAAALEDAARDEEGLPPRFAEPADVSLSPEVIGTWETLPGGRLVLWRLRIVVPGALSLNIGFDRYRLPRGGRLVLHPAEGRQTTWEFTEQDNREHGELWTPVVLTDDLVVELTLPASARHDYDLHVTRIGKGYRLFGEDASDKALWCNNDVVCPEGDPWRAEIRSVGLHHVAGYWFCSGAMVNNTSEDGTPYFLTARHCLLNPAVAHTMVVYWNFQSPICGQQEGGSFADHQLGAIFRASYTPTDCCLVELEEMPDPSWKVAYAGWDRSGWDAQMAVGIHHPWNDEKSISFEYEPTTVTSHWGDEVPGDGTHIRVADWDDGIVEPGSSGSPLFNENHHIVGQCHGTYVPTICETDPFPCWYGRFSVSWVGGGTPSSRLLDWLGDPLGPNPTTLDLYDPNFTELEVVPIVGLESQGAPGGPFSPSSRNYTLENFGSATISYQVAADVAWLVLSGSTSGSLSPGASATITVSIGAAADDLPIGVFNGLVSFLNLTNGSGDTTRSARLAVGTTEVRYSWNLETDPGWVGEGEWAYGEPLGQGGDDCFYGSPDPVSGYTGPNVLGYNLAGNYVNNMPERHLTTNAIDCSDLRGTSLRFQRWLNVETFPYDRAFVRVSNDSVNWSTVWENFFTVEDSTWLSVEYDISEIADGQESVYVRWTMGSTDYGYTLSGWNIDDIEILELTPTAVEDGTPRSTALGKAIPNPFNPRTEIHFELAVTGWARLQVYDLRGRLVTTLADEAVSAGLHSVTWNGRDSEGREVPSGVYLSRLEAVGKVVHGRMTLVR